MEIFEIFLVCFFLADRFRKMNLLIVCSYCLNREVLDHIGAHQENRTFFRRHERGDDEAMFPIQFIDGIEFFGIIIMLHHQRIVIFIGESIKCKC